MSHQLLTHQHGHSTSKGGQVTFLLGRATSELGSSTAVGGSRTAVRGEATAKQGKVTSERGEATAKGGSLTSVCGEATSVCGTVLNEWVKCVARFSLSNAGKREVLLCPCLVRNTRSKHLGMLHSGLVSCILKFRNGSPPFQGEEGVLGFVGVGSLRFKRALLP